MVEDSSQQMTYEVFLSWSGSASGLIAPIVSDTISALIPSAKIFYSTDIEPGHHWPSEIGRALSTASYGILLVTPENINSRWLLFEAGALWKNQKQAPVCPLLVGFDSMTQPPLPISLFQTRRLNKQGLLQVLMAVASRSQLHFDKYQFMRTFELAWPGIASRIESADKAVKATSMSTEPAEQPRVQMVKNILSHWTIADLREAILENLDHRPPRSRADCVALLIEEYGTSFAGLVELLEDLFYKEALVELCEELNLDAEGSKALLALRILEVGEPSCR